MPQTNNIPTLSVNYTTGLFEAGEGSGTAFDYSAIATIDTYSDASQLEVRWTPTVVYTDPAESNGVLVAELPANVQQNIIVQDTARVTVDPDAKTLTVDTPAGTSVIASNGITYYYGNTTVISASEILEIRRATNISGAIVEFQPGGRLTSEALNLNADQTLFAIQELTQFGFTSGGGGGGGGGGGADISQNNINELINVSLTTSGPAFWDGSNLTTSGATGSLVPDTTGVPDGAFLKKVSGLGSDTAWDIIQTTDVQDAGGNVLDTIIQGIGVDLTNLQTKTAGFTRNQVASTTTFTDSIFTDGNVTGTTFDADSADVDDVTINTSAALPAAGSVTVDSVPLDTLLANTISGAIATTPLTGLADVNVPAPSTNDIIQWSGSEWTNTPLTVAEIVRRSDRLNPLTAANNNTYTPTIVGVGADGRAVYEIYEEVTGTVAIPANINTFTGLMAGTGVYNVESEVIRVAVGDASGTLDDEFRGQAAAAQLGIFVQRDVNNGEIRLRRSSSPSNSTVLNSNSITGFVTRYQISSDPVGSPFTIVPQSVVDSSLKAYAYCNPFEPDDRDFNVSRSVFNTSPTQMGASAKDFLVDRNGIVEASMGDSSNNMVLPSGVYKFTLSVALLDNTAGLLQVRLKKNNSNYGGSPRARVTDTSSSGEMSITGEWIVELDGTDSLGCFLECTNGTCTVSAVNWTIQEL